MLSIIQPCFETIMVFEQCVSKSAVDKSLESNNFHFSFEELVSNKLAENKDHHMVDTKLACSHLVLQLSGGYSFEPSS